MRSPQSDALVELLAGPDVTVHWLEPGLVEVSGIDSTVIGETAAAHNIVLHELTPQHASLEEAFVELTRDEVEFAGTSGEVTPELREAKA